MLASRLGLYRGRYAGNTAVILRLLRLLRHYEGVVAVDLGCSTGYIARMASRTSRIPVIAIDIKRYNEQESNRDRGVEYLLADARYLSFKI